MFKLLMTGMLMLSAASAGTAGYMLATPVTPSNVSTRLYSLCLTYKVGGTISGNAISGVDCSCMVDGMNQRRSLSLNAESVEIVRKALVGSLQGTFDPRTFERRNGQQSYSMRKTGNMVMALLKSTQSCTSG